jgi:hypothetical protein
MTGKNREGWLCHCCNKCGEWYDDIYLAGYNARDLDEFAKRCNSCKHESENYTCNNFVTRPGGTIGRGTFHCSEWEEKDV